MEIKKKKFIKGYLKFIDSIPPEYLDEINLRIKGFDKTDLLELSKEMRLSNNKIPLGKNMKQFMELTVNSRASIIQHF